MNVPTPPRHTTKPLNSPHLTGPKFTITKTQKKTQQRTCSRAPSPPIPHTPNDKTSRNDTTKKGFVIIFPGSLRRIAPAWHVHTAYSALHAYAGRSKAPVPVSVHVYHGGQGRRSGHGQEHPIPPQPRRGRKPSKKQWNHVLSSASECEESIRDTMTTEKVKVGREKAAYNSLFCILYSMI